MRKARCTDTIDLLNWRPETLKVARFEERQVRSASLKGKIAMAVSSMLKDAQARDEDPIDREEVSRRLSLWMEEDISKNMLDAWSSPGRDTHNISGAAIIGLSAVLDDSRLLTLMADELGLAAIPKRFEATVQEAILVEQKEDLEKQITQIRGKRK